MRSTPQPQGLISVLTDKIAEFGDRHDAAMDLEAYDESIAEDALILIVTDISEDEDIVDAAAESLLAIWHRKNKRDAGVIAKMHSAARTYFE
jgi:hypothetical protein